MNSINNKWKEEHFQQNENVTTSNNSPKNFFIKSNFFGGDKKQKFARPKPYGWIIFSIVIGFVLTLVGFALYWAYNGIQSAMSTVIGGQTSKYTENDLKNVKFYGSLALLIAHAIWAIIVLISIVNMFLRKAACKETNKPYNPTSMVILGFFILALISGAIWAITVNLNYKIIDGNKNVFEYFMLIFRPIFSFIAAILSAFTLLAFVKALKNKQI